MFWTRLASGVVLLAVIIGAFFAGNTVMFVLAAVLSLIGLYEVYKVHSFEKTALGIGGYIAALIYIVCAWLNFEQSALCAIVAGLLILMCIYVFSFPKYKAAEAAFAAFGVVYVPVLMMFLYKVRSLEDGLYLIPLVFISAWGNDTCAYCVGMLIGKHKMSPKLSPKKSIEGFIGGVVGAALLGALYGWFLTAKGFTAEPIALYALMCGAAGMFSVVGDLTASAIKRDFQIKDYGKLIPGHGGVMDRFDSILFTAPVIYFIAIYF